MSPKVQGFCPVCGSESLFLGAGGYVTCSRIDCPEPDAVSSLLDDRETAHIVTFRELDFTIRHPLRERLRDELPPLRPARRAVGAPGPARASRLVSGLRPRRRFARLRANRRHQ
jgi:hypothetical protein